MMRIVVLSRQASLYSTRRLVETARQRGHQVDVVDPLSRPLVIDSQQPPLGLAVPVAVIPRIGASVTEFGCAVLRQLELQGIWTLNPAIGIARSRDKLLSTQLLHGSNLPVPRTAVVGDSRELPRAIEAVGGLPAVLKLRRGTQGRGVVLVFSLSAAFRAHSALSDFQQYTLVQEFVSEAQNRDIRVIVVGNRAVAAMERQAAPGDFRANLHRGGHARPLQLDDDLRHLALRAAQVFELGFAGVDLLMTRHGPVVIEVNSSPGLEGIEATTGVDIASAVMHHVENRCPN